MPIDEPSAANRSNWNHPVGIVEVFGASTVAGLVVTGVHQHRELEWQGLGHMVRGDEGLWRLVAEQPDLVPLRWPISATRPA